jgi:hypothetical protein
MEVAEFVAGWRHDGAAAAYNNNDMLMYVCMWARLRAGLQAEHSFAAADTV